MKAILCVRHGPPEALEIAQLPDPAPGPGEAVVEVAAAALNFFDTLIIAGRISTHVDAVYPLERAAEAPAAIARRQVRGKVVLEP